MTTREDFLAEIRLALGKAQAAVPPVPGRVPPRPLGERDAEMAAALSEIGKLGGKTQQLTVECLADALAALVKDEGVRKATLWQTAELRELGVERILSSLGVEIVSPHADKHALAQCDLGITGADAAFPETGTLLLRSTPERPRMVSLVPRIHLAIVTPKILMPDLGPAFEQVKGEGYLVFVTGPSRTADIELTAAIGVHGPKALYVWNVT